MLEVVNRDLADRHEAGQLKKEEKRAELETYMTLWDNADGTVSGKFTIPELHGQILRAALERLTSPRRWSRNKAGEPVEDGSLLTGAGLSWTERLGAGFAEIIEHLPTEGHAAVAAALIVKADLEHLQDGLASAGLDTGIRISPGEARRLACEARIIPAVMGGPSLPLDLGRSTRLHSEAQRRALSLAHDSCAVEGCDRPFAWCEIHHPDAWSTGGRTDLHNAIPLCAFHHRRAHDEDYAVSYLSSGEVRVRRRRRGRVAPAAAAAA